MIADRNPATKLTAAQVVDLRQRYAAGGVRQIDLAAEFGLRQCTVSAIVRREIWRHLP